MTEVLLLLLFTGCLVIVSLTFFVKKDEIESSPKNLLVFPYSPQVKIVLSICLVALGCLAGYELIKGQESNFSQFFAGGIIFFILCLIWYYYFKSKIYLTDDAIIKATPFGRTKIYYSEIKKIVIYDGRTNNGYAMTRIYGNRTIQIPTFISRYNQLVNGIRVRCKSAKIIEK